MKPTVNNVTQVKPPIDLAGGMPQFDMSKIRELTKQLTGGGKNAAQITVETISQEMARTHDTIRVKIENHVHIEDDMLALGSLRHQLHHALENLNNEKKDSAEKQTQ